jgi:hypothetical protein
LKNENVRLTHMSNHSGYYQDMGPFGAGFWVGYGGGMAVMFWGTLIVGGIWVDWSSASAESATSGIVFMNIIAVLMGIGHAETASRNAAEAAQTRSEIKSKTQDMNRGQGLDPKLLAIAVEMGSIYIKAGARKFRDLVRAMVEDLGLTFDQVQPYARNAYNQARGDMDLEGADISDMDTDAELMAEIKAMRLEDVADRDSAPVPDAEDAPSKTEPNRETEMGCSGTIDKTSKDGALYASQPSHENIAAQYNLWANYLLSLKRQTRSGQCLIGLGEVVSFFESVADEIVEFRSEDLGDFAKEIEFSVTISANLSQGESLRIVYLELSDQGFELGEICRDYDSYSRVMYSADPFYEIEFQGQTDWRDQFEEVLAQGNLRIDRSHI